jgi:cell division ATPase FtsA
VEAVEAAGVAVADVVASPLAASTAILTRAQKAAGVVLANIGSETVSIAVFENGSPISIEVFPVGSMNVTNDIALGLRIPLEEAEGVKRGAIIGTSFPQKKLDEIIEARLCDIFESIENNLKKIKRAELLPAGLVFVGGGANVPKLEELAKSILKLPSQIGTTEIFGNAKTKLRDPAWFTAVSLLISNRDNGGYFENSLPNLNLTEIGTFRFFKPEKKRFPCLELGYEAKRKGGTMPAVLNAANEVAVERFLKGAIKFVEIPKIIERTMLHHRTTSKPNLNQILEADQWGRLEAEQHA